MPIGLTKKSNLFLVQEHHLRILGRKAGKISPTLSNESLFLYMDMIVSYFQNAEDTPDEELGNLIRSEYKNFLHLLLFGFFGKGEETE